MAEEKRPSRNLISKAIQSERQSNSQVDLDHLKNTLAKSSLWKTNTLRRIENTRSGQDADKGDANDSKNAVLQSLKRSLLQLVDQHWKQLASGTSEDSDAPLANPGNDSLDVADTQRRDTKLQNEYNGMRKALSVQVKEVIKVRRRLRKQEKKVKARDEEISHLQKTIDELRAENTGLAQLHEQAVSELQAENTNRQERDQQTISDLQTENANLTERYERSISELRDENASLQERHSEEINDQQERLIELQAAYDQFQQQSDQLLTELDRENALLRAGEAPANDDAQFAPVDVNAQ